MFSSFRSVSRVFVTASKAQQRVEQLHAAHILPGSPAFDKYYDTVEPTKLSKETGIHDALLDDPLLHISVIKYNKHVVERYNLSPEQEKDLLEEFDLSFGDSSFEYHLPLPVPEHNFEELPIIKSYEAEH
eukprot:gene5686-6570_t